MSYGLQLLSAPKSLSTVAQSRRKMTICHSKIGKNEGHGRVDYVKMNVFCEEIFLIRSTDKELLTFEVRYFEHLAPANSILSYFSYSRSERSERSEFVVRLLMQFHRWGISSVCLSVC